MFKIPSTFKIVPLSSTTVGLILAGVILWYGIGLYPLLDNNEGLYASIALEMLKGDSWIIPHANGVPYLEKPPLLYWLIAVSFKLFGVSEVSARLIPAAAAFITIGSLVSLAKEKQDSSTLWMLPLMVVSCPVWVVLSRMVLFDGVMTCFLTLSLSWFFKWYKENRPLYLRLSYCALAGAVLTKGLVAIVLVNLVVWVFFGLHKPARNFIRKFLDPWGIGLFLALTLPWHLLAHCQQTDFAWFYFINEHFLRFLDLREPRDYYQGPLYYYLPKVILYIFPWSLLGLTCLRFKGSLAACVRPADPLRLFLWIWFGMFLIFFSVSKAKATYYMMAGMPPLLVLIYLKVQDCLNRLELRGIALGAFLTFIAITAALLYLNLFGRRYPHVAPYMTLMPLDMFCGSLLISVLIFAVGWYRRNKFALMYAISLPFITLLLTITQTSSQFEANYSSRVLAENIPYEGCQIFLYQDFEDLSSLPFYLQKRVPIIDSKSRDLLFGEHRETDPQWFLSNQNFLKAIGSAQETIYVAMQKRRQENFESAFKNQRFCQVFSTSRTVLYKNSCS